MTLLIDIAALVALIAIIIWFCELFTNAIEWTGKKLGLNEGAVGSVLAAVGTALPETVVPLIALIGGWLAGHEAGGAVAEGAIVGAPFMLATLAMFVTGVAVIVFTRRGRRTEVIAVNGRVLGRDLTTFLVTFIAAIGVSFLPDLHIGPVTLKQLAGLPFLAAYGFYVARTLADEGEMEGDIHPLTFDGKRAEPRGGIVALQVAVALLGIVGTAHFFVERLQHLAEIVHLNPLILSLLITPIATELPEKLNSVLWIGARKDTLALGNLTGAMVFQTCIPMAVGMMLTPWILSPSSLLAAGLTVLASGLMIIQLRVRGELTPTVLLAGGFFYALFTVGLFAFRLW
ncbi:MAG: sodium:calcium antiporter [Candidatus Sericytochromatia bacterium]|nr:sodium:calcium antiporter [Candidatus Sericytochromatia bacterium]